MFGTGTTTPDDDTFNIAAVVDKMLTVFPDIQNVPITEDLPARERGR